MPNNNGIVENPIKGLYFPKRNNIIGNRPIKSNTNDNIVSKSASGLYSLL